MKIIRWSDICLDSNEVDTVILMEGTIIGKRTSGKLRKSFFEETFQWMGFNPNQQLKETTCDEHERVKDKAWSLEADDDESGR